MFAVVYVPQFSLQAVLRHQPELWARPVVLVDSAARTPLVCEMTEAARASGITPGLSATQAMARCSQVLVVARSSQQENASMAALLRCAYAFSPHLEATAPGLCTLDRCRLAALAQAERQSLETWARKVQTTLAGVQLSVAVGVGTTPNVARHAARWGKGLEVVEKPEPFMATLPVRALDPSTEVALLLKRWGIGTVGELLALGEQALSARLGLEALALLAAASSTAVRPLHLTQPTERFEESFEFQPEVETLEPVLFLLRRFVDQLGQALELRGFVAEALLLQLGLDSGEQVAFRLNLPQPTRQPDVLFRTLHTRLETVRTESPVKSASLTAFPTQGGQKQLGLFETVLADPHRFQETLARLTAVLGPGRVGTPTLDNSHRPDAFHLSPPDFENAPVPAANRGAACIHSTPIRRFRPALKAEVECEAPVEAMPHAPGGAGGAPQRQAEPVVKRPISIRCSVTKGKLKILVGPWRASGNWWEAGRWEREEWDAAMSDGQVIRLVHQPDGWFVEGIVD